MAPLIDKFVPFSKGSSDQSDGKSGHFSLRWLLKRSKSSRSAREMSQSESKQPVLVTTSKSCDTGMTGLTSMDRYSSYFLWKIFPSRIKTPIARINDIDGERTFKTSFSCSDVSVMFPITSLNVPSSHSNYQVPSTFQNSYVQKKVANRRSYGIPSKTASSQCLDLIQSNSHNGIESTSVQQLTLCKLCLRMLTAQRMYVLKDCGCSFCISCMQDYLFISIRDGNIIIACPEAECKGKVLPFEIKRLVGDETFRMFKKFKLDREIEIDPYRTWCPTPGCETVCYFQPPSTPSLAVSVYCFNCQSSFCSSCKLKWHPLRTCEEARAILEEDDFNMSENEDSVIKRCPNCRVPIERDEGCAQMMCKRCKHVFCWHCLESLDDDFLLRHYDKGPCRNKLGHSRASMVWHRTQVIGIFAGFSFLLLVASPILLLAAPCLLCCRCRNCKFFYEEATPL